jgi:hypothetical protein
VYVKPAAATRSRADRRLRTERHQGIYGTLISDGFGTRNQGFRVRYGRADCAVSKTFVFATAAQPMCPLPPSLVRSSYPAFSHHAQRAH